MQIVIVSLLTLGAALVILFCPRAPKCFYQSRQEGSAYNADADLPHSRHPTIPDSHSIKRRNRLKADVAAGDIDWQIRR